MGVCARNQAARIDGRAQLPRIFRKSGEAPAICEFDPPAKFSAQWRHYDVGGVRNLRNSPGRCVVVAPGPRLRRVGPSAIRAGYPRNLDKSGRSPDSDSGRIRGELAGLRRRASEMRGSWRRRGVRGAPGAAIRRIGSATNSVGQPVDLEKCRRSPASMSRRVRGSGARFARRRRGCS